MQDGSGAEQVIGTEVSDLFRHASYIRPVQDGFGYLLCIEISRSGESARSSGLCRGVIHSTRQAVSDFGNEL